MAKLDGDAIKAFFTNHGEKFGFGAIVAGSLAILYFGFSKEGFEANKTPEQLATLATTVRSSIDQDHWAAIAPERKFPSDFPEKAQEARKPINPASIELPAPFNPVEKKDVVKRKDPDLLPPEQVKVVAMVGALSVKTTLKNPIADLEKAEPPKEEKKKEPEKKKPARGGRGGADPYGYGADGMNSGAGMEGEMGSSSMGGAGYGAMMGGSTRRLNPIFDFGYRSGAAGGGSAYGGGDGYGSSMGGGAGMEGEMSGGGAPAAAARPVVQGQPTAISSAFIAGSCVIPHKKMVEEYERVFKDAKEYNQNRDIPKYVDFRLQRADVTDKSVDQLQDADWVDIWGHDLLKNYIEGTMKGAPGAWETGVADPVPNQYKVSWYASPSSLTLPLPPLLLQDYSAIAYHPAIPKTLDSLAPKQPENTPDPASENGENPEEPDMTKGPATPGGPGVPAAGGSYGGSYGGATGYGGGGSSYGGGDSYGGADSYGGGASSYGGGYGGSSVATVTPDFQLLRFYDFMNLRMKNSIRPGRKYVYRVRVTVEDPNFPQKPVEEPRARYLAPEVLARIDRQKADDLKAGGGDPKTSTVRTWYRSSTWSAPSEPVSLSPLPWTWEYAGSITKPTLGYVNLTPTRRVDFERAPPMAKVVALRWSDKYATFIPASLDKVTRGWVLNRSGDTEIIDQLTSDIRKLPGTDTESTVQTDAFVLDIFSGDNLAASTKEVELATPGAVLIFDGHGKLKVLDEIDNSWKYRLHTFSEEKPPAAASAPAAGGEAGMNMGGGSEY